MPHSLRRVQVGRVRRLTLAVLAACVALIAAPGLPAARADVNPAQLADALMSYDALYVATGTGKWETDTTLDYLRKAMGDQKLPVYVMVLPKSKDLPDAASQDGLLKQVAEQVGRSGTYVLLTGPSLRVHSTSLSPATTDRLIQQAKSEGGKNQLKVMGNLIRAAGTAPQETTAPGPAANGGRYIPPVKEDDSGSMGTVLIVAGVCVVAALAAAGVLLMRRRMQTAGGGAAKPGKHTGKPGTPSGPNPGSARPADGKPAGVNAASAPNGATANGAPQSAAPGGNAPAKDATTPEKG
ncbi:hypothetical protein E1287_28530 [Actinomadura sp. KC06]|uniref:hypothetical protein n=1 Tax=Actinomadura sp. KC06 TaxID=2530369 RepID=UPI001051E33A|nr:hypothetical protein [Actinomadura sp. KC06]TDD30892.1 hypothetical protein E1287_28530 [Actinomadura sp. KC06]